MKEPTAEATVQHGPRLNQTGETPHAWRGMWAPSGRLRLPVLRLRLSERKLLLLVGDVVLLNSALLLGLGLAPRAGIPLALETVVSYPIWFVVLTGLWGLVATAMGAYDLRTAAGRLAGPLSVLASLLVVAVVYFFVPYWSAPLTATRLAWALFVVLAGVGLAAWRLGYAAILVQPRFRSRVVIVGAGHAGQTTLEAIQVGYDADYQVVGFVDDHPEKEGAYVRGVPVVGTHSDLVQLIREQGIEEVIVSVTDDQQITPELFQALMDCHELGATVRPMVHLYEELTGRLPVEHIGQQLYALVPLNHNPLAALYRLVRRSADLAVSLLGLALLALVVPVVALVVRMDSPGPIFYQQTRLGKGGRPFQVFKFRTMVEGAEQPGQAVWAEVRDARVTRFGRFARRVRLDEAPQLWNVLRGEMSLIGPRPERPEFVEELQAQIPFYRSRLAVKPGLTGWAQVNYGYGNSVEDALTKLQYDLYYIKHQTFYLDLVILLKTVGTVLTLRGT